MQSNLPSYADVKAFVGDDAVPIEARTLVAVLWRLNVAASTAAYGIRVRRSIAGVMTTARGAS